LAPLKISQGEVELSFNHLKATIARILPADRFNNVGLSKPKTVSPKLLHRQCQDLITLQNQQLDNQCHPLGTLNA
jgi:hypothetical protein